MANMAFGVPCVRDFLAEHGHVLTVRGYDYKNEIATVRDLGGSQIKRKKVCEILTENDLAGFVSLSGFKTTVDWWRQIKRFCKGRMYLYRVELYDELIDKLAKRYDEREQRRTQQDLRIDDVHPLDIRNDPSMRDPALVDLTAAKAQAHADRMKKDADAIERKHERMREIYGEQMQAAPTQETHDPERIMRMSNAEQALKALCGNSYAA